MSYTALVFGASGNVGRAAAKAFFEDGATVIAPTRRLSGLDQLKSLLKSSSEIEQRVLGIEANLVDDAGRKKVLEALKGKPPLKCIVSSFGPWFNIGPLSSISPEKFRAVYESNLYPHFYAWKLAASLLKDVEGSSHIIVTGAAGYAPEKSGITGIAAAGLMALSKGIIEEAKDFKCKVTELCIAMRVENDEVLKGKGVSDPSIPSGGNTIASSRFGSVFRAVAEGKNDESIVSLSVDKWESLTGDKF
eukprot:Plantae.Rhodophyta-Hildenbrandia_rubra.ctg3711.p1 GENE.Plantae.Rhodophyta-Hildenbrandia_rubra.ctg3711~~Plantae.Rhodophyta-Hildenbrandia_rubra.ctg3711.p1  ORF type:complete len:248 (-),score=46.98 Plantae.Rhodophyta-Hildenbrandia_rubra.ctg3711:91-834(-)